MAGDTPTKTPPSPLKRGESMPPGGLKVLPTCTAFFVSVLFFVVPVAATVILEPIVKPEEKCKQLLELPDPLAAPIGAALFHFFILQWLAMLVNSARVQYSVPWPTLYAEASHPHCTEYNCVQRAHQHVLEQTPLLLTLLGIASLEFPLTGAAAASLFSFSKIIGNVFGYAQGKSKAKNRAAFGYLGLLTLLGLAGLVGLRKAGKVDVVTTHVETAVEAAKPLVNKTLDYGFQTYEAAKPHMDKAYDAARPHMDRALDAAAPYMAKARELAAPYVSKAVEAAGPYREAIVGYFA